MLVETITWNNIKSVKWDAMIAQNSKATIFHTWSWIQTIHEAYNCKINVVLMKDKSEYVAAIPFALIFTPFIGERYVCLPYTDHYSFFTKNKNENLAILRFLVKNITKSIQIRDIVKGVENISNIHIGFNHKLNLTNNPELIFEKFDKKQIQQRIRKLKYNELSFETGISNYHIWSLYDILINNRNRLNSFCPSKKYFKKLYENILCNNKGYIALVKYKSRYIAGGLFLLHNNTLYSKHGASLKEYWYLHPNHFLNWEIIKKCCFENIECLDFGRTGITSSRLRKYKMNWGAKEEKIYYSTIRGPDKREIDKAIKVRYYLSKLNKSTPILGKELSQKFYEYFP